MKIRHILCSILIFLFCSLAYAKNTSLAGIELCSSVHSFLKKNGFSPSTQSLLASGENTFPYNIIVTFSPEQNTSPDNLLLIFFQDDVPENQKLIKECLQSIKEAEYPFTVSALFAYGEKQKLQKADMIYGSQVYLESLNTNLSYTAIIFNLEDCENKIETISAGLSSPPQLIKNSLNLYTDNNISGAAPIILLSQLSSYKFIYNRILDSFFSYEIPAIELELGNIPAEEKEEKAAAIIKGSAELFSKTVDSKWEHHFLIIRLFGSYHIISESRILQIVIPTIFIWLIFIFILIFVNRRLKKHTWYTVAKVWWSVPLTFAIMEASFFVIALLFRNLDSSVSYAGRIYGQLSLQIITALFFSFISYILILTVNYGFEERAIDYLLVISCFINQSLFILADISLSPIFIIICILSLLALTIKNNLLHYIVFLLMIVPLIPYGHRMVSAADLKSLSEFLSGPKPSLIIPLVLYPIFIFMFRLLTAIRSRSKKIKMVIIHSCVIFAISSLSLILLTAIRTEGLKNKIKPSPEITLNPDGEDLIELTYSQKKIFGDVIRTINVELPENCLLCDLVINTDRVFPVLYSDNDYISLSNNSVRFRIPDNPPQNMTFSYGAAMTPSTITLSAVIEVEAENEEAPEAYQFITKSIETGER